MGTKIYDFESLGLKIVKTPEEAELSAKENTINAKRLAKLEAKDKLLAERALLESKEAKSERLAVHLDTLAYWRAKNLEKKQEILASQESEAQKPLTNNALSNALKSFKAA